MASTPPTPDVILQLMFDRPSEPIFMPRGENAYCIFDVPDGFVTERLRHIKDKVLNRFEKPGRTVVTINNVNVPDLSAVQRLGRKENFSLFNPVHTRMATSLLNIFMAARTLDDLISIAAYCHDRLNPYLFNYALSAALLHRVDTRNVNIPNFLQCFPGKFFDSSVFKDAREEVVMIPGSIREAIVIPREYTANSREPEQAVAYWREDIGLNLHHWHWHLVYPESAYDHSIVAKDRRGELFYYMHQQIITRYNIERFANGLRKCQPYDNLREIIPEGYFPKLERLTASRNYASRFMNSKISKFERANDGLTMTIETMELWFKNIQQAIEQGFVLNRLGKEIALSEERGIDILGNLVEASVLTPNSKIYGSYHIYGHLMISSNHDPDGRFKEDLQVMGDTATAMRDPIFYRWHTHINDIFVSHKDKLPKYTAKQLSFDNIKITEIQVNIATKPSNELITFWQQSEIDLSRGLDFAPRGPLLVRFTHLQHEQFDYLIKVKNSSAAQKNGTMRIFMAPRLDDRGVAMKFNKQRYLMIELDKFKVTLKQGDNIIKRSSLDSSVTIPFERTYRSVDAGRPGENDPAIAAFNFCGCGWPQNLLIPKGTAAGMLFDLFVMVSDYDNDKIVQDTVGNCNDAESYCGIQDRKYPDTRSMGYPFDRVGRNGVDTLQDFLTPNMKVQQVTVKFEDRTEIRQTEPDISVIPAFTD